MEEAQGIGAPIGANRNARVAHIRKFVCAPPERGAVLRLIAVDDPPTVLAEWPRAACIDNGSTATDVDGLLREHATTCGVVTIANLTWISTEGHIVCTKRLKCAPDAAEGGEMNMGDAAAMNALGINSTREGGILQMQRGLEASMRMYHAAHQTQIAQGSAQAREARELCSTLGSLLKDSWTAAHQAHLELDKLRASQRAELDRAAVMVRDATESAAGDEESEASAEFIRTIGSAIGQAMPFIVAQVAKKFAEVPAAPADPVSQAAE